MAKIEDLVGDIEVFRTILEGFLAKWEGAFDVMPADPPPNGLFGARTRFAGFCKELRSAPDGEALCIECDKEHARVAAEQGKPIHYICHAGMLDIAVPVLVDGKLVATIFCGQCRSWDEGMEQEGRRRTIETARKLGLPSRRLLDRRKQTRQTSQEEVSDVEERLWKVATYLAGTGHERLELLRIRSEMLRETQHIQSVMNTLTTIVDVDRFWSKLDSALECICLTIGADYAAVFVSEEGDDTVYRLKSTAGLRREELREYYPGNRATNDMVISQRVPLVIDFDPSTPDTLCHDLAAIKKDTPGKVVITYFQLNISSTLVLPPPRLRGNQSRTLTIEKSRLLW